MHRDIEIRQIFTIYVAVALKLLPLYSSDYPDQDKSKFYKFFCQWDYMQGDLVELLLDTFCRSDKKITQNEFISRAQDYPYFFDSLGLREEVKREISLREMSGNRSQMPSHTITDIPGRYAQVYLYQRIQQESGQHVIKLKQQIPNSSAISFPPL